MIDASYKIACDIATLIGFEAPTYEEWKNTQDKYEDFPDEPMLGSTVEDTVTGYIGVLTAITHYFGGDVLGLVETDTHSDKWITLSRLKEI